jgi:spore maturation protein CgeB
MNIFVFGSSIVSSYWNGAATYYRGIYKYLARLGHQVTFAEPDAYGRQQKRDSGDYSYVRSLVYAPGTDVSAMLARAAAADVVIKHSGIGADDDELELRVLECQPQAAVLFWDVDAPATIARMNADPHDAFARALPRYDAVLTYGGGPEVAAHYRRFGARAYHSIYNGLDPDTHHPVAPDPSVTADVLFLGNRLPDREARVDELFLRAAELAPTRTFLLGGEGWEGKPLPPNVRWLGHVPTSDHNRLNCSATLVMNINRASMASFGFSPPTRIFEVAGAGAPLLCDAWPGIEEVFEPEREILIIRSADDVVAALDRYTPAERKGIGARALARALQDHTYAQRALRVQEVFSQLLVTREALSQAAAR